MDKILFIKTPIPKLVDDALEPDMGLLYVATYVEKHVNAKVRCIDLSVDSEKMLLQESENTSIFCFSTFTATYSSTVKIVKKIKRHLNGRGIYIAGGHHVSALPDQGLKDFDYIITGEGEIVMAELIAKLLSRETVNKRIWEGNIITDLDQIDDINYDLVDLEKYSRIVNGKKSISILTSRGCPYKCEFCNSTLSKSGRTVRFKSAEKVVNEILALNEKYQINAFRIQDDIFSLNKERLIKIADMLEGYNFDFRCFARIDNMSDDILYQFKRMGVKHISFGIESGSQRILDAMNKGLRVENIKANLKKVIEEGFIARIYLIVGYPGETYQTIQETIELVKECRPHEVSVYPLIPYPGTPLYKEPEKYGITFIDKDFSKYYQIYGNKESGYVFETENLALETIKEMRNYLVQEVEKICIWSIDSTENI